MSRSHVATLARIGLSVFLLVGALGVSACAGDTAEEASTTETNEAVTQEDAAQDETEVEDAADSSAGTELSAEQADQAIGIAGAYFVAQTDFTRDQFEWKIEAAAVDSDGQWWAHVSATPIDMALESEQIYVYSPADTDFWFALDMGTGIDPATDERFPEEVRDQL